MSLQVYLLKITNCTLCTMWICKIWPFSIDCPEVKWRPWYHGFSFVQWQTCCQRFIKSKKYQLNISQTVHMSKVTYYYYYWFTIVHIFTFIYKLYSYQDPLLPNCLRLSVLHLSGPHRAFHKIYSITSTPGDQWMLSWLANSIPHEEN